MEDKYMEYKSHKIIEIKEEENNVVIEFIFTENGQDIIETQTIHAGHVYKHEVDPQSGLPILKSSPHFDLSSLEETNRQIIEYAHAYIRGKNMTKTFVHESIKNIVGK